MSKCVLLLEDEPELASLVEELLTDAGFRVVHVPDVDGLLLAARQHSPCVALIDGGSRSHFDRWCIGPQLVELGVPPVAFTAHTSAQMEFEANSNGFVGIVTKPFDADEFIWLVQNICWQDGRAEAS